MRKKVLANILLWSMIISGCSLPDGGAGQQTDMDTQTDAGSGNVEAGNAGSGSAGTENTGSGNVEAGNAWSGSAGTENAGSGSAESGGNDRIEQEAVRPSKEEVLAMREQVLKGMSAEEIKRLTENIKVANQRMESAYLYDAIFDKLEDKDSLYWNYFDEKGEIQVGWEFDGSYQEMKEIMEKENLSKEEFDSRYGTPVMVYNRFDAGNFMKLMEEMKDLVQNEKLKDDLQQLIDETGLAAENHEMEHASNVYRILHDMDYYLLRYGLEDVGKYVQDTSTIATYYGVLSVYE